MHQRILLIVLSWLLCTLPAAAHAAGNAASKLIGQYELYLESGVASGLALEKDGRFRWRIVYADAGGVANGSWQTRGAQVVLTTDAPGPLRARVAQVDEPALRSQPEPGRWVVHIEGAARFTLPSVDVIFQTVSGASASASTGEDGYAAVEMLSGQTWASIKIRRTGSADAWLTLPIPPAVAQRGTAVLKMDDLLSFITPAFTSLTLDIDDGKLTPTSGMLSGNAYERVPDEQQQR